MSWQSGPAENHFLYCRASVPMSIADACLVRLTKILPDPLLLTTDSDVKIYRRLGRRVIPTRIP